MRPLPRHSRGGPRRGPVPWWLLLAMLAGIGRYFVRGLRGR